MFDEMALAARIAEDTGIGRTDEAARALEITIVALGAALDPIEAEVLADELPARLAAAVRTGAKGSPPWSDDVLADLAAREGLPLARAAEYAVVACRRLGGALSPALAQLLERRLPPPWSQLLAPREAVESPPPPHHAPLPGAGHTLAVGRPGSRHALADHAAERTQRASVAREANPHADSKLSSGAPSGEPVAVARPDPHRRIDEADG